MSTLRASIIFCDGDPDLTVGAITCRRFAPWKTRGAGDSIKPGVERSGTPGTDFANETSPRSGRQPNHLALSPAPPAIDHFGFVILGFAPQALCCRALRALSWWRIGPDPGFGSLPTPIQSSDRLSAECRRQTLNSGSSGGIQFADSRQKVRMRHS
jgi:hypothetical protein